MKWNLTQRMWIYNVCNIIKDASSQAQIQNRTCPFIIMRNDFAFVSVPTGVATGAWDRRLIGGLCHFKQICLEFFLENGIDLTVETRRVIRE